MRRSRSCPLECHSYWFGEEFDYWCSCGRNQDPSWQWRTGAGRQQFPYQVLSNKSEQINAYLMSHGGGVKRHTPLIYTASCGNLASQLTLPQTIWEDDSIFILSDSSIHIEYGDGDGAAAIPTYKTKIADIRDTPIPKNHLLYLPGMYQSAVSPIKSNNRKSLNYQLTITIK